MCQRRFHSCWSRWHHGDAHRDSVGHHGGAHWAGGIETLTSALKTAAHDVVGAAQTARHSVVEAAHSIEAHVRHSAVDSEASNLEEESTIAAGREHTLIDEGDTQGLADLMADELSGGNWILSALLLLPRYLLQAFLLWVPLAGFPPLGACAGVKLRPLAPTAAPCAPSDLTEGSALTSAAPRLLRRHARASGSQ